ncbi:Interference hedgehog, partial [Eumeta japonica]
MQPSALGVHFERSPESAVAPKAMRWCLNVKQWRQIAWNGNFVILVIDLVMVANLNICHRRCGSVTSNPPAIWSFYRNGEKLPQTEMLPLNGALVLNTVTAKDSGNYTCSAMNPITGMEVKLPQRIDLRVDYTDRNPPYFLIPPVNQITARPGDTVVLECPGVGSPPPAAVWSSPNIMNINNNNRTRLLPYGLQITDVMPEDQGSYVCRLDNGIAPALVHT